MQNDITATVDGRLHGTALNPGDNVKTEDVLAVIVKIVVFRGRPKYVPRRSQQFAGRKVSKKWLVASR